MAYESYFTHLISAPSLIKKFRFCCFSRNVLQDKRETFSKPTNVGPKSLKTFNASRNWRPILAESEAQVEPEFRDSLFYGFHWEFALIMLLCWLGMEVIIWALFRLDYPLLTYCICKYLLCLPLQYTWAAFTAALGASNAFLTTANNPVSQPVTPFDPTRQPYVPIEPGANVDGFVIGLFLTGVILVAWFTISSLFYLARPYAKKVFAYCCSRYTGEVLNSEISSTDDYKQLKTNYAENFKFIDTLHPVYPEPDDSITFPGYVVRPESIKEIRPGATLVLKEDPVNPIDFTEEAKDSMYHCGIAFTANVPSVAAKHPLNTKNSIINRQLRPVDEPDLPTVKALKDFIESSEGDHVPRPSHFFRNYEEWNSRFPAVRQKQHAEAKKNVESQDEMLPGWLAFDTFVKSELVMKDGEAYDPRNINGCTFEVSVVLGPFIQHINATMKKLWNKTSPVYYTSGATVNDLGDWFDLWTKEFVRPFYLENDFSRFDSTIDKSMLEVEFAFYEKFMPNRREKQCLAAQIHTKGRTREGFVYKVEGTRKSGTPNTSLGNTYLNIWTHIYAMSQLGHVVGRDFAIMAVGDDMLMICSAACDQQTFLDMVNAVCRAVGFVPKAKVNTKKHEVEYCSKLFWPAKCANGEIRSVAGMKPGRYLVKHGWSVKPLEKEEVMARVRGTVLGHQGMVGHIPIINVINDFYLTLTKAVKDVDRTDATYEKSRTDLGVLEPCKETVDFFEMRYDSNLKECESDLHEKLSTVHSLPVALTIPILDKIIAKDVPS